jgi:signal peptidase I
MSESTNPAGDPFALQPDPIAEPLAPPPVSEPTGAPAAEAEGPRADGWTMVREIVETVVFSLIIFLLIRQVIQNYRIENHSMEPNFYEGQFVLVNKLAFKLGQPARGDVVVFHNPRNTNEDYIKRIIGLPGDTIEVHDSHIYVNGQQVIENFPHNEITPGEYMPPVTVGDNQLFVMGDNRPNSSDSRVFGPISQDLAVGKAWLRIWPFNVFGIVEHRDLPLAPSGSQ